jgi:hypothetical protein
VLPGFISIEIYKSIYPAKKTSDFISITWSLIYGVTITSVVLLFYTPPNLSIEDTSADPWPLLILLLLLIGSGIVVGLLRAGFRTFLFWLSNKIPILQKFEPDTQSIWAKVNRPGNEDWAIVFMSDGAIYRGYIKSYTFDPDATDQDFLLSDASRVNEDLSTVYQVTGQGVYLRLKDVNRIEFVKGELTESK